MAKVDLGGMTSNDPSKRKGVVSGIDTEVMIQAAVDKRKAPIKIEQDSVIFNNEKIAALSQLNNLLESFQSTLTTVKGLRFTEDGTDALKAKLVTLSAPVSEDPTKFVSISATPDANLGSFNLQVTQIAQNKILRSAGFASNTASATNPATDHSNLTLFTPGTFQINGVNVTIAQGDTLAMIASNINNLSGLTKVSAQVINPTTGVYNLLLQSTLPGLANNIVFTDPTNVLNNVISSGTTLQAAQDAVFLYNGVTVQRSTNSVSDFINGVVFNLYSPTQVTVYNPLPTQQAFTMNASIIQDIPSAVTGIKNFVDSYNTLIKFATQQQGRDEYGNYFPTAKIQHDDYISNLITNITILAAQVAYVSDSSSGFGITLANETPANPATGEPPYKNLMILDTADLTNALSSNFENVRSKFEFDLIGNTNNFIVYSRGNQITSGSVAFDIDIGRPSGDMVRATYNGNTVNMTFTPNNPLDLTKGGSLKGVNGTFMDGYEFVYAGTGVETFSVTINQGIGDKLYNVVSLAVDIDTSSGTSIFQDAINSLIKENYNRNRAIAEKLSAIEAYRESLVQKYSRMEASIAKSNAMLTFLEAQLKAMERK